MWGTPRDEVGLPNHVDLVGMLDIVDLEKGQEVAGSRGYYLKGAVRFAVCARSSLHFVVASHLNSARSYRACY
jgi:seryl-tRNA synthetase